MTSIVTIKSSAPVAVTSERVVDDGRERHPNGVDHIAAGAERTFIVDDLQSLRVEVLKPEQVKTPPPAADAVDGVATGTEAAA